MTRWLSSQKGCAEADQHTIEIPKPDVPKSSSATLTAQETSDGKEIYTSNVVKKTPTLAVHPEVAPIIEEEDDLSIEVAPGTHCRRTGCKALFVSDELSRSGDGEEAVCIYHPSPVLSLFVIYFTDCI